MLSAESSTRARTPSGRISYARIDKKVDGISYEKFEIPNLIELQLDSFAWFVDKGLRELFDEISPIKDFTGKVMELQFLDYEFGAPKYSETECRTKDLTFSKPLYVNVELLDQGDRRDPAPARLHGRLPVDDRPGHLRHQRRRAGRRQPARPLAGRLLQRDRGSGVGPDAVQRQGHPEPWRLARVRDQQQGPAVGQGRPQAQARRDHPAARGRLRAERRDLGAVHQRRHRPGAPVRRVDARQGPHPHPGRGPDRGLQEAPPGRSAHRRQRAPAGREPVLQLPPLRPRPGRPLQVQQEARRGRRRSSASSSRARVGRSPARTSRRSSGT